jgi:hypothetical protein
LTDDKLIENEETGILSMGTPVNAVTIPGTFLQHTVRIQDNEQLLCENVYTLGEASFVYVDPPVNSAGKFSVTLKNWSDLTWEIVGFTMSWSDKSQWITKITFGGSDIWVDPPPYSFNSPFPSSPTWTTNGDRTLGPQTTKTLVFQFTEGPNGKPWTYTSLKVHMVNPRQTCYPSINYTVR